MDGKPTISIITVTFNAESTLPATLRSILEQRNVKAGTDYEFILMDGKSSDKTVELAESAHIPGAKIFSEPDTGIYHAMNKAMDKAVGDYYMFLNAGDALHSPDTLRHILDAIADNDMPGVVYGQTALVDADRKFIAPRHLTAPRNLTYKDFANGMLVCHQAFIALARIAPYYNLRYRFSADYEWCLKCLQHSRKNVYVDETLVDYLSEGMTTRNRLDSLRERFSIMCYFFGTANTVMRHLTFVPRYIKHKNTIKKSQN